MTAPEGTMLPFKAFADREDVEFSPMQLFCGDGGTRERRVVGYQSPERFAAIWITWLVLRQRMTKSLNFLLERAYEKGWTFQRIARTKSIERRHRRQATP